MLKRVDKTFKEDVNAVKTKIRSLSLKHSWVGEIDLIKILLNIIGNNKDNISYIYLDFFGKRYLENILTYPYIYDEKI